MLKYFTSETFLRSPSPQEIFISSQWSCSQCTVAKGAHSHKTLNEIWNAPGKEMKPRENEGITEPDQRDWERIQEECDPEFLNTDKSLISLLYYFVTAHFFSFSLNYTIFKIKHYFGRWLAYSFGYNCKFLQYKCRNLSVDWNQAPVHTSKGNPTFPALFPFRDTFHVTARNSKLKLLFSVTELSHKNEL